MSESRTGGAGTPPLDGSAAPGSAASATGSGPTAVSGGPTLPGGASTSSGTPTPPLGASVSGVVNPFATTLGSSSNPSGPTGARRPRISQELTVGAIIAERYQVVERLSAGGMGVVYKARHIALDDLVALKLLLKPQREEDQKRFLQEARVATKIKHPNTVYVSDFGVLPDGRSYLAMEFLRGKTLADAIHEASRDPVSTHATTKPAQPLSTTGPTQPGTSGSPAALPVGESKMDPLRVCRIAVQIARGLLAVHEKGIIHRDLKPENVFLVEQDGQQDFVKIVDFGIAKATRVAGADKSSPSGQSQPSISREEILKAVEQAGDSLNVPASVTLPGSVMGTPAYMSPEAIDGRMIDARADQYSLGCVLFEMLTGHTPFRARSAAGMLMKHLSDTPPTFGTRAVPVPAGVDSLVQRLLCKTADERLPSMRDVIQVLEREIDLMLVARGEKTVLPTALAGAIAGRGLGAALVIGGRRLPLLALVPLALVLIAASGSATYYLLKRQSRPTLKPGEMLALRAKALEVLRADLANPSDAALRLGAVQALGQSQEPSLRASLEALLADSAAGPELQAQAASTLGLLGERQAASALRKALSDSPSLAVQLAAATSLRVLGDGSGEAALVKLLDSKDAEAQFRSALLLCNAGPTEAQKRGRDLLRTYAGREGVPDEIKLDIWACLARGGDDAARSSLQSRLQTVGPASLRVLAAARLAQLGDGGARAFLTDVVRKKEPEQLLAARLLSGPDEPSYRPLFRDVVVASHAAIPTRVLSSEGLGASAESFDARLLGTLLEPPTEAPLRQAAAAAILQLAAQDPSSWSARSLAWARGALADRDWLMRQAAVEVLADSSSQDAVALLASLLADADPRIRRSAAKALGRRKELAALLALRSALDDSDAGVRGEALRSLSRLVSTLSKLGIRDLASHVGAALRRLLERGDKAPASERLLALGILARLGDRQLAEQILSFKDTPDPEVRRLFIEQLDGAPELWVAALGDASPEVRLTAARKLAERGDSRAVPVLRELLQKGGVAALEAYGLLLRLGAPVPSADELAALFGKVSDAERLAAVAALSRLPVDKALALLLVAARDPHSEVRRQAAETASELPMVNGAWAGLPVLRLLLADSDASVRARAQALLDALSAPTDASKDAAGASAAGAGTSLVDAGLATVLVDAAEVSKPASEEPEPKPAGAESGSEQVADEASAGLEGEGLLQLKGPDYVQVQLDGKRWQYLSSKAMKMTAGTHQLVTLAGKKEIDIAEKKTTKLEVPPSPIEEAAHSGIEAYNRKDYSKAQKLLERAYSRCERARGLALPCANLTGEITFYLGQAFEDQGRFDEAATMYQQVVDAHVHGRLTDKQLATASSAISQLSKRLGLVIIQTAEKSRCKEKKIWLPPGQHRIKVGSDRKDVKVRERETVTVGSCA
ncbi:MAG: HEAT repeat domain-containing protein [Myxococcales bacterium]|nr:HEAT repeat domain-containing protein [Myxococcales bacterium]